MERIKGWQQRLYAVTVEAMGKPHAWGRHDCVTFASDVVQAVTGSDPMGDLRGTYDGPVGAARVMREQGADTLAQLVATRLPECAVSAARRGDIVVCEGPDSEFVAVCVGRTAVGPSAHGMIHIPMAQARRAFRVGV